MTRIISISINEADYELIKRLNLSPSKLLRQTLATYEEMISGDMLGDRKALNAKLTRLTEEITKQARFMNKIGVYDDFLEEKQE